MSEAIRFFWSLDKKYRKEFDGKLVDMPTVIANEELQKNNSSITSFGLIQTDTYFMICDNRFFIFNI